jgi:hypothetical protein
MAILQMALIVDEKPHSRGRLCHMSVQVVEKRASKSKETLPAEKENRSS